MKKNRNNKTKNMSREDCQLAAVSIAVLTAALAIIGLILQISERLM